MNPKIIGKILGIIIFVEGLFMMLCLPVSWYFKNGDTVAIFEASSLALILGAILWFTGNYRSSNSVPTLRDSLFIVSAAWFVIGFFGAFPYFFHGAIPSFTDAFFESVSGFTTTGSSILTDIESVPKGLLFWRSLTHWIGGMGIIMLIVAILPVLKSGGISLFSSEYSTVSFEKIRPRIIDNAKRLWGIYISLTVAEIILLCLGGMNFYESVCHSFATVATGGYSTKNDSVAGYSPYIQYVIMTFMLLSGINFILYARAFTGNLKKAIRNEELHLYLKIVLVLGIVIALNLVVKQHYAIELAFRESFFQVISVITATGFATADYLQWPISSWVLIFFLMFVGACAGSTGGGIKVVRHVIALKYIGVVFKRLIHKGAVVSVQYDDKTISPKVAYSILNFSFLYILIFCMSTIAMTLLGMDFHSSMGGVITAMGGIGPGLGTVGPAANFAHVPMAGKYLLCFLMILGRLEILPFLVLFQADFWAVGYTSPKLRPSRILLPFKQKKGTFKEF